MKAVFACVLGLAACIAPAEDVHLGPPTAYDVTVTAYELPLALAEELEVPADEREYVIASGLDLDARVAALAEELAKRNGLVRTDFPAVRALPNAWTAIAAPKGAGAVLRGLELAVFPMPRESQWAPTALDVSVTWRGADGIPLARLPSSAHPFPPRSRARIVCLPPSSRSEAQPAIAAFIEVVPVPTATSRAP